jgi:hypothetical protein
MNNQSKLKILCLFCCQWFLLANAQSQGDLGVLLSSDDNTRWGVEYRHSFAEQYQFKLGVTHGEFSTYINPPRIVFASDSVVIQKEKQFYGSQWGIRIGGERQLKKSMFALGADLNLSYRSRSIINSLSAQKMDDNGIWLDARIVDSTANNWSASSNNPVVFWEDGFAQLKQHFFVPALRITFNMDVPIGDAFFINFSLATSYAIPIYMGRSEGYNAESIYHGNPPTSFEFETVGGIGLRYNIGTMKRKTKNSTEP